MKTSLLSNATLTLLASAAFLFTGCNTDANGVDTHSVINSEVAHSQQTKSTQKTDAQSQTKNASETPAAPAASEETAASSESTAAETETAASSETEASKISDELKTEYLDAINAARAETQDCGEEGVFDPAPALTWNDLLGNAAWEHSNDMAQSDTFSHTGSGTASDTTAQEQELGRGSRFRERVENHGYTDYRTIGENIAGGYGSAEDVVEAWLASDHHCANLMNPKFTEVGMALVEKDGTELGTYWTQEFGGR